MVDGNEQEGWMDVTNGKARRLVTHYLLSSLLAPFLFFSLSLPFSSLLPSFHASISVSFSLLHPLSLTFEAVRWNYDVEVFPEGLKKTRDMFCNSLVKVARGSAQSNATTTGMCLQDGVREYV